MKNSKLRTLLKAVESAKVEEDSFEDLNLSVFLNHRGAVVQPDGTCHANTTCSNNSVCNGNMYCSNNGSCGGNTACQ